MNTETEQNFKIASREQWLVARKELLAREKELTRQRDAINAARRALPWVKVEKEYIFDTPQGTKTLAELFDGRSQLIVYHFMWKHQLGTGCMSCSFLADHIDGANLHLSHHDVTLTAVSRAPLPSLEAYKKRMDWRFPWVSSAGSDFNFDFQVSFTQEELKGEVYHNFRMTRVPIDELPGISVFCKSAEGEVLHTYSSYARGTEEVVGAYMYLDFTPYGRNENGPFHSAADWVRPHDRYGAGGQVDGMGGYIEAPVSKSECQCHGSSD